MLDWGKLDFEPGWLLLHHYTTKRAKIWIFFNHFFPLLLPEVATIPINYFLQINFSIVTLSKNYYDIDKLFPINWLWEFYAWSLTKIELQIHHREYLLLKLITARLWQWLNLPNKKKSNHQVFVSTPTGRNSWELSATLSEYVCAHTRSINVIDIIKLSIITCKLVVQIQYPTQSLKLKKLCVWSSY